MTLTAPAGALPLTGTRALGYAFDDGLPGARSSAGVVMGNGNLMHTVSQDAANGVHTVRWEDFTSYNMPSVIRFGTLVSPGNPTSTTADRTLSFVYGPEHQRIRQQVQLSGNGTSAFFAGTTWYLNGEDGQGLSYEKEIRTNGTTEHKHYVAAGGMVFAMHVSRSGTLNGLPAVSRRYFHHDHLGSIAAVTNELGQVAERLAYDPWGKRRNPNGTRDLLDTLKGNTTERGFTIHEHLDEVGLVHMNGRVYDPLVGRFMSADPLIQSPDDLQSFNRYAYVFNNPLALTDPSGYFSLKKLIRVGIIAFISYYTGTAVSGALSGALGAAASGATQVGISIAAGAVGGFVGGAIATGTLSGGLQGAFTGAIFGGIGGLGGLGEWGPGAFVAAHAVGGCITSAATGGKCGQGALAAGFAKYATIEFKYDGFAKDIVNGVKAAVAGGTASVLAGGKFESGATTATFAYLFNHLSHATFNRKSGELYVRDADTGNEARGLFFSGTGPNDQIPAGDYAILQRGDKDGFRLEPYDKLFGNDQHDGTGQSLLRLHGPGRSNGCVTACDATSWTDVQSLIRSTSTSLVTVTKYWSATLPGGHLLFRIPIGTEQVKYYGRIKVD